nr:hypothetical protein BaRGS_025929 [Batillaria attramentaria]
MEQQQNSPQILNKLSELPIVSDTCHQVLDIYERTKGHNFLFRTTFGLAEATAKAVAGKTVPIITSRCQPQVERVNSYACDQLDVLEEKFPIITRPTEEVLRESKEKYDQTVGPYVDPLLRPAVAAVNVGVSAVNKGTATATAIVDTGKRSVSRVTKMGTDTVSGVYGFGKNQVEKVVSAGQDVVNQGLQTPYGKYLTQQFDESLVVSEELLDKYLPEEDVAENEKEERGEEMPSTRKDRVMMLSRRLHRRLHSRAGRDLKHYRAVTLETIQQLGQTFDVINMLKGLNSKIHDTRQQAVEYIDKLLEDHGGEEGADKPETLEDRSLALLHLLMVRVRSTVGPLVAAVQDKCGALHGHVQQVTTFMEEYVKTFTIVKSVSEISSEMLKKAQETLPYVTEIVLFTFDRLVESLDWFALDLHIDFNEVELADVAMANCNGMVIRPADADGNHEH